MSNNTISANQIVDLLINTRHTAEQLEKGLELISKPKEEKP
jgi:hypothetical protein